MTYILYKSNGQKLATIADGSIDKTTTDLTFVGKNYAGYGEILNQNLVKLLENFSSSIQPARAIIGQLWYDSDNKVIKLYDGTRFKSVQTTDVTSGTRPLGSIKGDLWFNEFEQKLYFYNGTSYVLIGPYVSEFNGIAVVPAIALTDNELQKYTLKFVIEDELDRIVAATVSRDEFTPNYTDDLTTENYKIIKKGVSLPGADITTGDSRSQGFYFWGTAGHALNLGDYPADAYFRRQEFTDAINLGLHINNDYGLFVGAGQVFQISADTGAQEAKFSVLTGNTISFNLQHNGATTNILKIIDTSLIPNSTVGVNLGSSLFKFNTAYINTVTVTTLHATNISGAITGSTVGTHTGDVIGDIYSSNGTSKVLESGTDGTDASFTGSVTGNTFGTHAGNVISSLIQATGGLETSTGQIKGAWSLVGTSTLKATYADLAERYAADAKYTAGTVLVVGGDKEVTLTTERASTAVAGIVSTNPAYMLNSDAGNDDSHPYIALKGRVPCRVVGPIIKGELLVTSRKAGYAEAAQMGDSPNAVIGKALEDFEGSDGVIEIKV
jgi:hypothetical protein